jgi:hypothetical protein
MDNVVSVRIALLFRTDENFRQEDIPESYTLLDVQEIEIDDENADKILGRVVTTTVTLRNRT